MTERFKLAANALLKRRLNNLVRIDNNVEIDRDFITCAEYQLFIDDMRQQGKNRQPDHWTSEKFTSGDAKKPITGVRASDAEEFCAWLTNQETLSGFKYRLPNVEETQEILAKIKDIGCWCKDHDNFTISGITAQQWQNWQQKLSEYLIFRNYFVIDFYLNLDINFNLQRDLYLNLYRDLKLDFDLNFDLDFYLNFDLDLDLDLYRNLYRDFNRDLNRDLNLYFQRNLYLQQDLDFYLNFYLNFDLDLNLDLNFYVDFYVDFYRDLNRGLNFDLDFYRNLYEEINSGKASNLLLIYFPLIFPIFFYRSLTTIYGEAAQNTKTRQKINCSREECEKESQKYAQKKDKIFQLYTFLVLIDHRQKGNMPAWEGIRIVREREEID